MKITDEEKQRIPEKRRAGIEQRSGAEKDYKEDEEFVLQGLM